MKAEGFDREPIKEVTRLPSMQEWACQRIQRITNTTKDITNIVFHEIQKSLERGHVCIRYEISKHNEDDYDEGLLKKNIDNLFKISGWKSEHYKILFDEINPRLIIINLPKYLFDKDFYVDC